MAKNNSGKGSGNNPIKSTSPKNKASSASASAKSAKKKNYHWRARVIIIIIIAVVLGVSLIFENSINSYLRLKGFIQNDYNGLSTDAATGGSVFQGERLNVHFVDVGQGDACIIELPDDRIILIDGGKDKEKDKLLTYIEQNITDENGNEITGFDIAILTHSDEDHCGAMDDALLKYPAEVFYRPNQAATYNNYKDPGLSMLRGDISAGAKSTRAYMRAIDAGHVGADKVFITDATDSTQNLIVPENISKGDAEYYEISFYTPTKDYYKDVNDYSPIMILEYQNKRIALSGDAEKDAEKEFVALASAGKNRYDIFDSAYTVHLIKLGHHGSRTSSSEDYINVLTTPQSVENVIIVISCGDGNSYGHPHEEVLERLTDMGFRSENILRTDVNGNIAMSIREETAGNYKLYFGAEMVREKTQTPLTWREIAIILFVVCFMLLIVEPVVRSSSGKKRKKRYK